MKSNWKLVVSFMLFGVLLFTLSANAEVNWSKELNRWDGKTLKVIMIADPWVEALKEVNKEFEKLTGAKVVVDSYGYDETHEKEVLVGVGKSSDYDVIVLDAPWVGEFAEAGYVEDLRPYIKKTNPEVIEWNDFVKVFRDVSTWKDKIIGMPFAAYFVILHYRKDLFGQAGVAIPRTIQEWKDVAAKFTNNPAFPGIYGTAMNYRRGAAIGQAWFEYIWNLGGKPFASTYIGSQDPYGNVKPLIDSKESIETINLFKEMLKYQPPGAESYAWDERATAFSVGKVAMVSEWTARTPLFVDPDRSKVADKFATAVVPSKTGVKPVPPLGGWVMGMNKYGRQKDLTWDYIKWFTSSEVHKKFADAGGPPSRYSTMLDPKLSKKYPWFNTVYQSAQLTYAEVRPRIPESFEIIDTVGLYASRAVQGEMSTEDAMKRANKEVSDILVRSGYKFGK